MYVEIRGVMLCGVIISFLFHSAIVPWLIAPPHKNY
jgi:hypothetical protein